MSSSLINPTLIGSHIAPGATDGYLTSAEYIKDEQRNQTIQDTLDLLHAKIQTLTSGNGSSSTSEIIPSSESLGNRVILTETNISNLQANTLYEINTDILLSASKKINVPEGVTFLFTGGSISGGSFDCNDPATSSYYKNKTKRPRLLGDVKFNKSNYNLTWVGGWANDEVDLEWFNPSINVTSNNNADLVAAIASQLHDQVLNVGQMYPILKPITISSGSTTLRGKNQFQGGYATYIASCNAGFYIIGKCFSAIIQTGGRLNLIGISLIGATSGSSSIYGARNGRNDGSYSGSFTDKYGQAYTISTTVSGSEKANSRNFCGFDLRHGSVELIEDCCFNGFCRGISFDGSKTWESCTPGFINRCFISCCKWGLYALFVSDFFCTNCKFNSCNSDCSATKNGSDVSRSIKDQGWVNSDTKCHDDFGGGVFLGSCAMIQFDSCRWEFNYLGLYIDNASYNISITGSIFDRHTHSILCIYNSPNHWTSGADVFPDRHQPATAGINFSGNNILRGLGIRNNWDSSNPTFTPGVAYFCFKSQPDETTDATVKASDNLRRVYVTICNNTFADNMEMLFSGTTNGKYDPDNVVYQHALYFFDCTDSGAVRITNSANDFRASKATHFCESYGSSTTVAKGYARIDGGGNSYPEDMIFSIPYYYTSDKRKNASIAHLNEICIEDGVLYKFDTVNGGGKVALTL